MIIFHSSRSARVRAGPLWACQNTAWDVRSLLGGDDPCGPSRYLCRTLPCPYRVRVCAGRLDGLFSPPMSRV